MLRGMVKSRRDGGDLYRQGNRPELVAKEEAEIAVIESFLPRQMDEAAMSAGGGGGGGRDRRGLASRTWARVMAALKAKHGGGAGSWRRPARW